MKSVAAMILLAGLALLAFATPSFASVPVYYSNCITWTPAQPLVGQPVTFGLDPSFMASISAPTWSTKNLVLNYGGEVDWFPFVFSSAGHYDAHVTVLFGTSYLFDDDGPGPNPAGYVHTFLSDISFDVLPVPEPSTLLALACGLCTLGGMMRLRRR